MSGTVVNRLTSRASALAITAWTAIVDSIDRARIASDLALPRRHHDKRVASIPVDVEAGLAEILNRKEKRR